MVNTEKVNEIKSISLLFFLIRVYKMGLDSKESLQE